MEGYHLRHVCTQNKSGIQILFIILCFEDIICSSCKKNRERLQDLKFDFALIDSTFENIILTPDVLVTKSQSFKDLANVKFSRLVMIITTGQQSARILTRVCIVLYCALAVFIVWWKCTIDSILDCNINIVLHHCKGISVFGLFEELVPTFNIQRVYHIKHNIKVEIVEIFLNGWWKDNSQWWQTC